MELRGPKGAATLGARRPQKLLETINEK